MRLPVSVVYIALCLLLPTETGADDEESPTLEMLLFLGEFTDEKLDEADQLLPLEDGSNAEEDTTND